MRLLSLELENWAIHDKLHVPLAVSLQIEGRNGTGKSSILEAVRFIFSKDARNYKSRIKNGTRGCRVKLEFSEKDKKYVVEKRIHLKNASTAQMILGSRVIASTPSEVYNRLQDILPENILDKLLYVPQDGLVELIENLRVKGGKQELDALLGLDRFEKIWKGAGDELKIKQAISEEVNEQIRKYDGDAIKTYSEIIQELEKENTKLEEDIAGFQREHTSLKTHIEGIKEGIKDIKETKKEKEELEKRINKLTLEIEKNKTELEGISHNIGMLKEKRLRLKEIEGEKNKLKKYSLIKEPHLELINEEKKLSGMDSIGEIEKEITSLEDELKSVEETEKKCRLYEREADTVEEEKTKKKQMLRQREKYLIDLQGLTDKAKCPRCGQKLTKAHVKEEMSEAEEEMKNLEEGILALDNKLKNSKEKHREYFLLSDELKKKGERVKYLRPDLEKKSMERNRSTERIESLKDKLKKLGYGNESGDFVESRVLRLESIRGEIAAIENELEKEKEYVMKGKKITEELEKTEDKVVEYKRKSDNREYNETLLDALESDKDRLQEGIYGLTGKIREQTVKIEYNRKEITRVQLKKEEFIKLLKREKKLRKDANLLKEAQDIFHTNKGIVKYLRERYISQLSNQMSIYFRILNQNPKYRDISFDKNYSIEIKTTEGDFTINHLSGGEKVQLAIALRIAMIRMMSPINLLILDEPFGSLVEEHRVVLGESLNKIALDGQLILVTHITVDSLNLPKKLELGGY